MLFGYQNPSFTWPGNDPHAIFERTRAAALKAEASGFVSFWLMDHLIQLPMVGAVDEPFLEGWTTLAALAAVTSRIRLGTMVSSVGYRNPALLAKMVAGVDIISGGRAILGIGAGWFQTEYRQYGYEFPEQPAVRIRQLDEGIQVIKAMWTQPRATFAGKYFQVKDAILEPKPVQKPHPPILVGGGGEQLTLKVAAKQANMVNWFGPPEVVKHKLEVLARHCDTVGRDLHEIHITKLDTVLIGRQEKDVQQKRIKLHLGDRPFLAGTVQQVIDQIATFQAVGVQEIILNIPRNDPETLDLLGSEVIPAF
ncbi:MAG: LLM class F420-dependent oxidoreductase [Anaerolineae bacterium]